MYFVQKNSSTATVTEELKACPESILRYSITICVNKNKQPDYYLIENETKSSWIDL